ILPSDYWRWWLLSHVPERSDAEFVWEAFQQDVNKDLADVLGNFVSRVTKFCRSKFGEVVPEGGTPGESETDLAQALQARLTAYEAAMDAIEIRRAAGELRALWVLGNEYLQAAAPWSAFKTDPARAAVITRTALNLIPFYATLSSPFIPDAAAAMHRAMDTQAHWPSDARAALVALPSGHRFEVPDVLFRKIADEERAGWQERFAGTRT
ncbi:MAG: class I tRNA ligase family protein, partial [Pseudomonadota bacterium]